MPTSAKPRLIRTLVVDDSLFMQRRMTEVLQQDGDIEIVGTARNARDAIRYAAELRPEVITIDIQLPQMDGLMAIERIMQTQPRPIVVVSSYAQKGTAAAIAALERGAIDLVAKPSEGGISLDLAQIGTELRQKVRIAARVRVVRTSGNCAITAPSEPSNVLVASEPEFEVTEAGLVTLIGSSTGGPAALLQLARDWRGAVLPPVVIAQHLPSGFTGELARQMADHLGGNVREAQEGDRLRSGQVLIAPGGRHIVFDPTGAVRLSDANAGDHWVPSIDRMFQSAANVYGARAVAVVMTGMGNDGTAGAAAIRRAGGAVWAQDEASSIIDGMPRAVREAGHASCVLPLHAMGPAIVRSATSFSTS